MISTSIVPEAGRRSRLTSLMRLRSGFAQISRDLRRERTDTLVLRLTLLLVLLNGAPDPWTGVMTRVIAGAMLLAPSLAGHAVLWWLLTAILAVGVAGAWHSADNHKYLIVYVCLACTLTLHVSSPVPFLRVTARRLVGFVFLFAVIWKVIGGDFLNGDFFYWTMIYERRLQPVAAIISGISLDTLSAFAEGVRAVATLGDGAPALTAPLSSELRRAALVVSWTGLLLEAGIAVLFLLGGQRTYKARHFVLMAFVPLVYFLLPVAGFAFVLVVLGLAQVDEEDHRLRLAYLTLAAVVQLVAIPWKSYLPV